MPIKLSTTKSESGFTETDTSISQPNKSALRLLYSAPPVLQKRIKKEFGGWMWMRINFNENKSKTIYSSESFY